MSEWLNLFASKGFELFVVQHGHAISPDVTLFPRNFAEMDSDHQLTEIRRYIGCCQIYSPAYVRARCELIYGPISDRTWHRWRRRVGAHFDPPSLGGMSEASYLLLLTMAQLLAGGSGFDRRAPIHIVCAVAWSILGRPFPDIPDFLAVDDLRSLIEIRAGRCYTDRYHRIQGLKKTQAFYSRDEAIAILSRYPNASYVESSKIP